MPNPLDLYVARSAVEKGILTPARIEEELREFEKDGPGVSFAERLVLRGAISPEQRDQLLRLLQDATGAGTTLLSTPSPEPSAEASSAEAAGSATLPTVAPAEPHLADRMGKYRVIEELGRGAMGVVYRAEDTELHREVALKTVLMGGVADPERILRFLREARTAATLDHPGIVPIHDMGVIDGMPFFAMGLVRGRTLEQVLTAQELPDLRERVRVVAEIARAVGHAHERRVVHRDLKPANVLLDSQGGVHVLDFGVAKHLDDRAALTATGQILGTPLYMSPEQMNGELERIGPASDVYSLGAILYEAVAGRPPWRATSSLLELAAKLTHEDVVPPSRENPEVDADLETVILKALEKHPERRYPTALEFAGDLARWLDGEPVRAKPISRSTRIWRKVAKHRTVVLPVVLLLLAGVTLSVQAAWARIRWARELAAHLDAGEGARARNQVRSARDEFQRVLLLDESDPRGRAGFAWADAEVKRLDAEAEAAREAMRKGGLAQNVIGRWLGLAGVLAELEKLSYDDGASAAVRRARAEALWPRIDAFARTTPDDPTSRSVMMAFVGWAKILAGRLDEGQADMNEAGRLDPDLPYAPLVEAYACFSRHLELQPISSLNSGSGGGLQFFRVGDEDESSRTLRVRMEELLARAEQAPVWGEEQAGLFRGVAAALRALRDEQLEAAERELSAVVEASGVPMFRNGFLFARARVRCYGGRFADAVADLREVVAARPGHLPPKLWLGLVAYGAGELQERQGGDPFPQYEAAWTALGEAVRIAPDHGWAWTQIGLAHMAAGAARARRGQDPREEYRKADAAHREVVRIEGWRPHPHYNLGGTLVAEADWEERIGGDGREILRRAIESYDQTVNSKWDGGHHWMGRAIAWHRLADAEAAHGGDPREAYARAISDAAGAIRLGSDPASLRPLLVRAHIGRADAESRRGGDPTADLAAALALYEEWAKETPTDLEVCFGRGYVLLRLGRKEEAARELEAVVAARPADARARRLLAAAQGTVSAWAADLARGDERVQAGDYAGAREAYEKGIALAGEAAERDPEFVSAHYNLACIHALLAVGKAAPGAEPTPVAADEAAGRRDAAFAHLKLALALGWENMDHVRKDADLESLHDDPRWGEMVKR